MASKAWEQREKESAPAYEAFLAYRDAEPGQRTVRAVAQKLDKSVTLIGRWSSQHDWLDRARSWDNEVARGADAREKEKQIKRVVSARARHKKLGKLAFTALLERFNDPEWCKGIAPAQAYAIGRLAMLATAAGLEDATAVGKVLSSGDAEDPFKGAQPDSQPTQVGSASAPAAPAEPTITLLRKLEIEVIGAGGQLVPASEIAANKGRFYDKPEPR